MSDTKLRPEDLNAEERAIVDEIAMNYIRNDYEPHGEYGAFAQAARQSEPIILARRALFAPAPEKATKCNHSHEFHGDVWECQREVEHSGGHECKSWSELGKKAPEKAAKVETMADRIAADLKAVTFRGEQPAPAEPAPPEISELDDRHMRMASPEAQAKFRADMDRRAIEIGMERLVGVANHPISETVTVGTWQLEELLKYADLAEVALRTGFHPPEFLFEPADRSLRQAIDAIKRQRDGWRTHAQPVAVGMTEELAEDEALATKYVLDEKGCCCEDARLAFIAGCQSKEARMSKMYAPDIEEPHVERFRRLIEEHYLMEVPDAEDSDAPYGDLCWLITCPTGPGHPLPVYYCGFSGLGTTGDYPLAEEDPNKAIRFCRLEDAQKIIVCSVSLTVGGWFASEHLFVSDRKGLQ